MALKTLKRLVEHSRRSGSEALACLRAAGVVAALADLLEHAETHLLTEITAMTMLEMLIPDDGMCRQLLRHSAWKHRFVPFADRACVDPPTDASVQIAQLTLLIFKAMIQRPDSQVLRALGATIDGLVRVWVELVVFNRRVCQYTPFKVGSMVRSLAKERHARDEIRRNLLPELLRRLVKIAAATYTSGQHGSESVRNVALDVMVKLGERCRTDWLVSPAIAPDVLQLVRRGEPKVVRTIIHACKNSMLVPGVATRVANQTEHALMPLLVRVIGAPACNRETLDDLACILVKLSEVDGGIPNMMQQGLFDVVVQLCKPEEGTRMGSVQESALHALQNISRHADVLTGELYIRDKLVALGVVELCITLLRPTTESSQTRRAFTILEKLVNSEVAVRKMTGPALQDILAHHASTSKRARLKTVQLLSRLIDVQAAPALGAGGAHFKLLALIRDSNSSIHAQAVDSVDRFIRSVASQDVVEFVVGDFVHELFTLVKLPEVPVSAVETLLAAVMAACDQDAVVTSLASDVEFVHVTKLVAAGAATPIILCEAAAKLLLVTSELLVERDGAVAKRARGLLAQLLELPLDEAHALTLGTAVATIRKLIGAHPRTRSVLSIWEDDRVRGKLLAMLVHNATAVAQAGAQGIGALLLCPDCGYITEAAEIAAVLTTDGHPAAKQELERIRDAGVNAPVSDVVERQNQQYRFGCFHKLARFCAEYNEYQDNQYRLLREKFGEAKLEHFDIDLNPIANGCAGQVFKCTARVTDDSPLPADVQGNPFALKMIFDQMEWAARLREAEADIGVPMEHPSVWLTRVYCQLEGPTIQTEAQRVWTELAAGQGYRGTTLFHIMDLQKDTLKDRIAELRGEGRPLSEDRILYYLIQLMHGLVVLQDAGYAHKDLKADNVMLDNQQQVVLIDFGEAEKFPCHKPAGNPAAQPPEVLNVGDNPESYPYEKADVWAAGVMAYEMVGDEAPYPRGGNIRWNGPHPRPQADVFAQRPPRLAVAMPRLQQFVDRALDCNAATRPDAHEALYMLQGLLWPVDKVTVHQEIVKSNGSLRDMYNRSEGTAPNFSSREHRLRCNFFCEAARRLDDDIRRREEEATAAGDAEGEHEAAEEGGAHGEAAQALGGGVGVPAGRA